MARQIVAWSVFGAWLVLGSSGGAWAQTVPDAVRAARAETGTATPPAGPADAPASAWPQADTGEGDEALRPADAQLAVPASPRVTIAAGAEFVASSAYVWRGFVPVDAPSVQPSVWLEVGDLTISSWTNAAGRRSGGLVTEHDFTVDYSREFGRYTVSAGWIHYFFPKEDVGRYSNESYIGLRHASWLNPTLAVYFDVHEGSGAYVNVGVSHEYAATRGVAFTPSVALGYNHRQWIDESTLTDLLLGLEVTLPTPVERVVVSPFVRYSRSLARDVVPHRLYGGVGIAVK